MAIVGTDDKPMRRWYHCVLTVVRDELRIFDYAAEPGCRQFAQMLPNINNRINPARAYSNLQFVNGQISVLNGSEFRQMIGVVIVVFFDRQVDFVELAL